MGLANRFSSGIKAFLTSPGGGAVRGGNLFTPRWSEPPQRNTSAWLDLYMKSPRMAPIHKIATDLATATYKLTVKNTIPVRIIEEHPLIKLFKRPCSNVEITGHMLFYLTEVYRDTPAGEAFWLIERNGLGVPTELWIIPPHWVIDTPTLTIPYFRILPMGNTSYQMIYAEQRDIIWFKEPNVLNPYGRGRGRGEAIGDEMETDEYMAKYGKYFFFNNATPDWMIQAPGADEPTATRIQEKWQQKYGGYKNAKKVAVIPWEAKATKLSDSAQEMDFVESRKFLRDACNQFWGMPPELFGILENANRSTIDAAYFIYTKNVLAQRLKSFDEVINAQLIPQFDDRLELVHDNVVPNDVEFELKKATEGLKYGGITVDEWRRTNGWKDIPEKKGNILYTPLNMMPTDLNHQSILDSYAETEEEGKSIKGVPKNKIRIQKGFDRLSARYEKIFERTAKKFFQGQQDRVVKAFANKSSDYDYTTKQTDDTDDLINWSEEDKALKSAFDEVWNAVMKASFDHVLDVFGFDLNFDLFNPKFTKFIDKYGLSQAKGINATTKEELRKTLSEGIEAGEGIPKLRQRITDIYAEAKGSRSRNIAITETHNTVGAGTFETYKGAGIVEKEWLTSVDGRERPSHRAINRQVVPIDMPFTNGLMHPGDASGSAQEVCGCRCTLLPVIPNDD